MKETRVAYGFSAEHDAKFVADVVGGLCDVEGIPTAAAVPKVYYRLIGALTGNPRLEDFVGWEVPPEDVVDFIKRFCSGVKDFGSDIMGSLLGNPSLFQLVQWHRGQLDKVV